MTKKITLFIALLVCIFSLIYSFNAISSWVVLSGQESTFLTTYLQIFNGSHCYYPKSDFMHIASAYTPLSNYVNSIFAEVFKVDPRPVRFCSFMFGLLCCFIVGVWTKKNTGLFAGIIAGLLAFGIEFGWMTEIGPNTMHAAFALLGAWILARKDKLNMSDIVLSALCLFASFWSKQTGLIYMAAGVFALFIRNKKDGCLLLIFLSILTYVGLLWANYLPNSDFNYWIFKMNTHPPIEWSRIWNVAIKQMYFGRFAILSCLALTFIFFAKKNIFSVESIFLGAAVFAGTWTQCKYGSGPNQMWPSFLMLCIVGMSALSKLYTGNFIWLLVGIQSLMLIEWPGNRLITKEDEMRQTALISFLANNGKTYYANHPSFGIMAKNEIWPSPGEDSWENKKWNPNMISAERRNWVQTQKWDYVIIDIPLEDNSHILYNKLANEYSYYAEFKPMQQSSTYDIRWKKLIYKRK